MTPICDFCSNPNVKWTFPAKTFIDKNNPIARSVGAWAACSPCKHLIMCDDRAGLALRCAESKYNGWEYIGLFIPIEDRIAMASQLHYQFFANRMGDPVMYEDEPTH